MFERLQNALSKMILNLRNFFRSQGQYETVSTENADRDKFLWSHNLIDKKVDDFMKDNPMNSFPAGEDGSLHATGEVKVAKLKASLHKLYSLQAADIQGEKEVEETHMAFSAKIEQMVPRSSQKGWFEILAKRMALYRSKKLAEDKKSGLTFIFTSSEIF